mmetsp:Transcript_723/g.1193  ORF Transcript_723/g.1193 Transcript_723/m.1193 type:complete len:139 (+) Transcript_723:300-716(+)
MSVFALQHLPLLPMLLSKHSYTIYTIQFSSIYFSRWVDTQIKGEVNKYTDKDAYKFGDLTKEIVRRVASGEYTLDDLFMLLKALAIFEASISPVAGFLPVKLLVELLNFSLLNDVAGKVTSALAMELDKRLKKVVVGG